MTSVYEKCAYVKSLCVHACMCVCDRMCLKSMCVRVRECDKYVCESKSVWKVFERECVYVRKCGKCSCV